MLPAPSTTRHPRLAYPDAFKLLAMVGVIIAHLPPSRFSGGAWSSIEWAQGLTGWCVLGFFAVAGMLFHSGDLRPLIPELQKRAKRLLIPWLAFTIFYKVAITGLAVAGIVQQVPLPPTNLAGFVSWVLVPASPQLYFLLYLFAIQMVCLIIVRPGVCLSLAAGVVALVAWVALASPSAKGWTVLHGSAWSLVPLYFACFAAAAWAGRFAWRLLVVAGLFMAAAAWMLLAGCALIVAWQLVAPWLLLVLLQAVDFAAPVKGMAWLGRLSGGVYVWHAPLVLGFVAIACIKMLGAGVTSVLCTVVLTFAVAALLGSLVNRCRFLLPFHL